MPLEIVCAPLVISGEIFGRTDSAAFAAVTAPDEIDDEIVGDDA
jgi:hypothetical protein